MARAVKQTIFVCQQCGNESLKWMGRCPGCQNWNSFVEAPGLTRNPKFEIRSSKRIKEISKPINLGEIKAEDTSRMKTGIGELDEVLGGGIVAGQVILVAGEPGIGKSTLLLQVAANCTEPGRTQRTLYVCGEESVGQVALRAERLGAKKGEVMLLAQTEMDEVIECVSQMSQNDVKEEQIDTVGKGRSLLLVVDSIQTMTTGDVAGLAGSVSQVRECAYRLIRLAKERGVTVFLVGHVTKDGDIAGPRVLEHMVDTVLWFEGERSQALRLVRTVKNRFGPTDEVGVFKMTSVGLTEVSNPSEYLLQERIRVVPGSVVSVVMEGSRPMLVEVQALTVPTQLPIPRRVATGMDFNRLQMLVAILTRRANLDLGNMDIFVNVVGGIKLSDPALDLAVCLAIASALRDRAVPENVAAVGEVGLMGEVRKVADLDKRIKEAKKLGYKVASAESGRMVKEAIGKLVV